MITRIRGEFTRSILPPSPTGNPAVNLLGTSLGKPSIFSMDGSLLARGILLLGASRSGKSFTQEKIIKQIRENMKPHDLLVILDTKGDYARKFYRPDQDCILGTGGPYKPTVRWNIFRDCSFGCTNRQSLEQRIRMIASRIFCKENLETPYFTDAPRRTLEIVLDALLHHPNLLPEGAVLDNAGLLAFIRRGNWSALINQCNSPEEVKAYIGDDPQKRTSTERSVLAELEINISEQLCSSWAGHGEFSILQCEKERRIPTLFLQYDQQDGGSTDQIYQLLIDLLLISFLSEGNKDYKLYLFLDEIHVLGKSPEFLIRTLNYGPGIGLGCICAGAQSLAQLHQLCGKAGAASLLAGLQTRIMFHVEDSISRDFVKDQCGDVQTQIISYSPGISINTRTGDLQPAISDMELTTLSVGEAIIKQPSYPAFFFQFKK